MVTEVDIDGLVKAARKELEHSDITRCGYWAVLVELHYDSGDRDI